MGMKPLLGLLAAAGLAGAILAPAHGKESMKTSTEFAVLGGGCFWCLEAVFDELKGVDSVESGYTGGGVPDPSYQEVCTGGTGHAEAVRISFDPGVISYRDLLKVFFTIHDPTTLDRQGADVGTQYRSAIFTHDEEQRRLAEESRAELEKSKPFREKVVTEIVPASEFYPAEEYHQKYYQKNPLRYQYYRAGCGRDARLKHLWGK